MNNSINNNGFGYVDLGLPSGTLWATMNVGALKPSDYGLYFAWGETYGYTADQIGEDKQFNWGNYKWSVDGLDSNFSKYKITGATLNLEDDAVHINMGGSWHMPTDKQIQELIDNTTSTWTTQDGINGRLFTSKNNGNSIFIPAAGYASNGSLYNSGSYGSVWFSVLSKVYVDGGQYLNFGSSSVNLNYGSRYGGRSVRGVI